MLARCARLPGVITPCYDPNDMKLSTLRALVAAVEEGSLRGAARRMGLTQPALTKMIRELERELGTTLLARSTTGVMATAQGKVLVDSAVAADRELANAVNQIRQLSGDMTGDLTIGAVPLAVMLLIPETLRTFGREFPGIRLRVSEELYIAQLTRLRKGEVDVAIGPLPEGLPQGEFSAEPLMPISMVVVVRRGHALERARSLTELGDAKWVFTGTTAGAGYAKLMFEQNGLATPPVGALVNSTLGLISIIASGDFVGLLPLQIALHPMTAQYLTMVPTREGPLRATLASMARADAVLKPVVRHFISHLHRAAHQVVGGHAPLVGSVQADRLQIVQPLRRQV